MRTALPEKRKKKAKGGWDYSMWSVNTIRSLGITYGMLP